MDNINERVKQEWKENSTSRERIKEVLEQTTEFTSASDIASTALVSEPTARKYLHDLVEEGIGSSRQVDRTTKYKRNEGRIVNDQIEELRTTHTHQELVAGIREMSEKIQDLRDTYGVDSPEDLAIELEPRDEGWGDVGRWQSTRKNLALAKAALQVDEAHRLVEA